MGTLIPFPKPEWRKVVKLMATNSTAALEHAARLLGVLPPKPEQPVGKVPTKRPSNPRPKNKK